MINDRLHEAAETLRGKSVAASLATAETPWGNDGGQVTAGLGEWLVVADVPEDDEQPDVARFIATMDPLMGYAMAEWLDFEAAKSGPGLPPPHALISAIADKIIGNP